MGWHHDTCPGTGGERDVGAVSRKGEEEEAYAGGGGTSSGGPVAT